MNWKPKILIRFVITQSLPYPNTEANVAFHGRRRHRLPGRVEDAECYACLSVFQLLSLLVLELTCFEQRRSSERIRETQMARPSASSSYWCLLMLCFRDMQP